MLPTVLLSVLGALGFAIAAPVSPAQANGSVSSKYIIRLKPGAEAKRHIEWVRDVHRRSLTRRDTTGVEKTYGFGKFAGYAGEFDDATVEEIKNSEHVLSVEPDMLVDLTALTTQENAPWGLESISSRDKLSDGNARGHTFTYDTSAGEGTFAYVLDSGVMIENSELEGRAILGYNAWPEEPFIDDFGHGSHVAGTIASKTYGVAKKATVVAVKVTKVVYGTTASVLDGYDWAINNITNTPGRAAKSVINLSLALPTSEIVNQAIAAAFEMDIVTVAGAGNDGLDASTRSPASAPEAITVGAVDWTGTRPSWSNYGPSVDIFAAGVDTASIMNREGREDVGSGTSYSTPHVSGLVLYLKGLEGLPTAKETVARVKALGTAGVVQDAGEGSPNLLAYDGAT